MSQKNIKNLTKKLIAIFLFCYSGIFAFSLAAAAQTTSPAPVTCAAATAANGDLSKCSQPFMDCFQSGNCSNIFCTTADSCGSIICNTAKGQCVYDNKPLRDWISTTPGIPLNLSGAPFLYILPDTCKTTADCLGDLLCMPPGSSSYYTGHCEYTPNPAASQHYGEATKSAYEPLIFTPQVTITGSIFQKGASVSVGSLNASTGVISSDLMQKYIAAIYNYGLAIVGILSAIMLMLGGISWLTSEGNQSRIEQAKSIIGSSLMGLILTMTAYMLLLTINPDLVILKPFQYTNNDLIQIGCCQVTGQAISVSEPECTKEGGKWNLNSQVAIGGKTCTNTGCCVVGTKSSDTATEVNVSQCLTTPEEQCTKVTGTVTYSGGTQSVIKFLTGKCSDLPQCQNLTSPCDKAADGDPCGSTLISCTCYGHKAYIDVGKPGEPCGNHGGSTCQNCVDICPDHSCCSYTNKCANDHSVLNKDGKSFDTWDWGSRSCESGYDCCHG